MAKRPCANGCGRLTDEISPVCWKCWHRGTMSNHRLGESREERRERLEREHQKVLEEVPLSRSLWDERTIRRWLS